MKIVKLYKFILLLFACNVSTNAQQWLENWDYRIEIGGNISTITNIEAVKSNYNYSARIGGSLSIPLFNSPINVSTGLFITQKGLNIDLIDNNKIKAKPTYLEIPLCLSYRIDFNEEQTMFFDLGGYGAVGVVGKFDFKGDNFSDIVSKDIFKLYEKPINRFDAGITTSVLYEYMSFSVRFGGSFGLVNAINNNAGIDYWKTVAGKQSYNMQLFLNLGYRFFYY